MAFGQFELTAPESISTLPNWPTPPVLKPSEPVITLGSAQFDAHTGRLLRLYGMDVDGPRLELWRGPTDNDRSSARGSFELGRPGRNRRRRRTRPIIGTTLAGPGPGPAGAPAGSDRSATMINCWRRYGYRPPEATSSSM